MLGVSSIQLASAVQETYNFSGCHLEIANRGFFGLADLGTGTFGFRRASFVPSHSLTFDCLGGLHALRTRSVAAGWMQPIGGVASTNSQK